MVGAAVTLWGVIYDGWITKGRRYWKGALSRMFVRGKGQGRFKIAAYLQLSRVRLSGLRTLGRREEKNAGKNGNQTGGR